MSFHEYAKKYCLNTQDKVELRKRINEETKLIIEDIIEHYQDLQLKY